MRILKQTKLRFTEGKSDKVYEVDLIQSADDEFVVNFRFGRFGTRLREGTRTPFPVDLQAGERIYEKLVAEKTKKGYVDESTIVPIAEVEEAIEEEVNNSENSSLATPEQKNAILNRLTQWVPNISKTEWSLARVIWRAGQLRINDALPLIARHTSSGLSEVEQYSVAWAIAKIGEASDRSAAILTKLEGFAKKSAVRRMIREARVLCMDEAAALKFIDQQKAHLSERTTFSIEADHLVDYLKSEAFYKNDESVEDVEILYTIGLKDSSIREVLLDFAISVGVDVGSFRLLRLLYKLSEARLDGEMYGVLVNRLEYENCKTQTQWQIVGSGYQAVKKGVFSPATKKYFKRRSLRNFETMGADGNIAGYITMATGILASASSSMTLNPARVVTSYHYNRSNRSYDTVKHYAPRYGNISCFTWLLRGKSVRLIQSQGMNWSYVGEESPEGDVKGVREEPFPELWNQAPDAIIHLLKHGQLDEVHFFANAVWQANPDFARELSADDIVAFIRSFYPDTKRLGLVMVESLWDIDKPDFDLLEALILCDLDEAREVGFRLLAEVSDKALEQPAFLAAVFLSGEMSIHERLRGMFVGQALPAIFEEMAKLLPANEELVYSAKLAVESLNLLGNKHSATVVDESELTRSLASENEQAIWFALFCYGDYAKVGEQVPEQVVVEAIESEFGIIREQGMLLLESFSDAQLIEQTDLIASCCSSKSRELRQGILPVLKRLVDSQQSFGEEMVTCLYPVVLRKETSDGIHDDVLAILLGPLASSLKVIPDDSFRRMLKSKYAAAHLLGFHLLESEIKLEDELLHQVLEWANHPHFELRQAVLAHLNETPERLLLQLSETRVLVESEWDEVRDFGMDFLRNRVPEERWTVEALVDLCDSVKPAVQDFGREMITKRFREEDGEVYMTKLSQHPAREMQLFATHFLKQTATDQPEIILSLEFYFRTVMGAVSSGRVAKDRVLEFLKIESVKDERVAKLGLELWNDHVTTCAIGDKAGYLEAILLIQKAWSNLEAKLKVLETEKREVRV